MRMYIVKFSIDDTGSIGNAFIKALNKDDAIKKFKRKNYSYKEIIGVNLNTRK